MNKLAIQQTRLLPIIHSFKQDISRLKSLKKYWRSFLSLVILFFSVGFLTYFTLTSKPGDLFFSIKLFRENLYADSTSEEKINKSTKIISDRVNSYVDISNDSNCTKLILAEEELKTQVKIYFNNLETYKKDEIELVLLQLQNSFSKLDRTERTCKETTAIEGFPKVFKDLVYKFDNSTIDINSELRTSSRNYNTLKELLATTSLSNQETLDAVEDLLVMFNENLGKVGEEENTQNATILLETNNLIYQTAMAIFEGSSQVYNREASLDAICLLNESEQTCTKDSLNSLWNSIYDKDSPKNQISLGEEMYLEYLKLISL
jgi:hypothetical protein